MDNPLEIVISPPLHPIKAFAVANHILTKIIGCPLDGSFDSMIIKLIGYSHEATDTIMSSRTPTGFTIVRSASSRMEGVGQRNCPNYKTSKTMVVIMLIENCKINQCIFYGGVVYNYSHYWGSWICIFCNPGLICHTFRHLSYNMNYEGVFLILSWAFNA